LLDIITIALCAVICGADGWVEVEEFGKAKLDWLRTFLDLPHGIPSHDTFGRVFAALNPAQFERSFAQWMAALAERTAGQLMTLDGKTLRRSHDRRAGRGPLHLVSAWANANRLVLAQRAVDTKSNEITALPLVLEVLDLSGCTVTIDAIGCQTAIAQQIVEQGGDYVLALKANQGTLYEELQQAFALAEADGFASIAHDQVQTIDKGHGRVDSRWYTIISEPRWVGWLNPKGIWKGLRSIGRVVRRRDVAGKVSEETHYYISSLAGAAQPFAAAVRDHWGIENRQHWVLDIAFREDESRVRAGHAAENLAVLRRLALNLLRQDTTAKVGIKARRLKAGWDNQYLLRLLTGP
jgi:predicted transposase YbfD/YdcC